MAYKTCDWCGRSYKPMFSADRDAGNAFADAMGLTIGVKAIGGIARLAGKRNFCSKQCKLAYKILKTDAILPIQKVPEKIQVFKNQMVEKVNFRTV